MSKAMCILIEQLMKNRPSFPAQGKDLEESVTSYIFLLKQMQKNMYKMNSKLET